MHGFGKPRRLLKKSDYDRVFEQATRLSSPHFIVLYRDNTVGHARLGLALSKKAVAKAHDRNRIKRCLRESFRLQSLRAVDLVVLAKPRVGEADKSLLRNGLVRVWKALC